MRTALPDLLHARDPVAAFTCYNLEGALGVIAAAEAADTGVVVLVSQQSVTAPGGVLVLRALCAVADAAPVPTCVQVDHVTDLELVEAAFRAGAGAVMADGSRLPLKANVAFTRAAARLGAACGGHVEAELGRVEGDEDVAAAAAAGALTDPDEAADFVAATRVACLAVSIGNVHGTYRRPPQLDWPRLEAVARVAGVPLALHGSSGLPAGDVRRCLALGVRKVNVNTELRQAYLDALAAQLPRVADGARVLELGLAASGAVAAAASATLRILAGRPAEQEGG